MNRAKVIAWAGTLLLVVSMPAGAQQLDSVVGSRGISTFGAIVEITRDQVTIEARGSKKVFPVNEIQKVAFGGEPTELRRARDLISRGQLEDAQSELQKISTDGITRGEILHDIEFFKGYCDARLALSGGGDKAAAATELLAFHNSLENKNSFHHYQVVEVLGDLAAALGSYKAAIDYYGMLEKAPWPDYQMRAAVLQARAMVANRQFAEALKKYETVLGSTRDDAAAREQKMLADIGKAVCLAENGQPESGIKILEKIIAENDSREKSVLFARAYNALGTCYLRASKPKDALLAFLHVDLMFFQDSDAHAEALYHLSQLWRTVNRSERALRARSLLQNRYGGSPWAKRE